MKRIALLGFICLALILAMMSFTARAQPATPTATPSPTASATPTAIPSPTVIATPTATPSPTVPATPAPAALPTVPRIVYDPFAPPVDYAPPVRYPNMVTEKDVPVAMRDGVKIYVDVNRPDTGDKIPAILSFAGHYKELQSPELAKVLGEQPAWSSLWMGAIEAGDTEYMVSRGYAHIVGNPRNVGKSEDGPSSQWDTYDLIEWIAQQPWCDGQVGMVGLSAFGAAQVSAAYLQPPHLKGIFCMDPGGKYSQDSRPGNVIPFFSYLLALVTAAHTTVGQVPLTLPADQQALWQAAITNPDYMQYSQLYNILAQKGQYMPSMYNTLVNPYAAEGSEAAVDANIAKINIPIYTGSGWYAWTYKTHLEGAQSLWAHLPQATTKKLTFTGPAHMERPFHQYVNEVVRWYDQLFKGINTGILTEPPVKFWVEGENRWMAASNWPLPETQWTKLYLQSWERLRQEPYVPISRDNNQGPDAFVQMPPTQTNQVAKLRYLTDPLPQDTLVAGPISLTLYASIDQTDDNWIVTLKDVGPDVSVRTARAEEREIPTNLPERILTGGWLKCSDRALDPTRSTLWRPWHPQTKSASKPVVPGEINEYQIEILSNANMFKTGHRICIEIASMDMPTGVAGLTNVEYIPYHVGSSKTTLHKIYHNDQYPSNLLLPVIPASAQNWITGTTK